MWTWDFALAEVFNGDQLRSKGSIETQCGIIPFMDQPFVIRATFAAVYILTTASTAAAGATQM